jgi:hypothetical protein
VLDADLPVVQQFRGLSSGGAFLAKFQVGTKIPTHLPMRLLQAGTYMNTSSKPLAADPHGRGGPAKHEDRVPNRGVRVKPVRVTLCLDSHDSDGLRDFAYVERTTHTEVSRAIFKLLNQESVADQIRTQ